MIIQPSRRALLGQLVGLVAAPAIVRASSLMKVKPLPMSGWPEAYPFTMHFYDTDTGDRVYIWREGNIIWEVLDA